MDNRRELSDDSKSSQIFKQSGAVPNAIKRSGGLKYMQFRPFTKDFANYEKFHQYDKGDVASKYQLPHDLTVGAVAALPDFSMSSHCLVNQSIQGHPDSSKITSKERDGKQEKPKQDIYRTFKRPIQYTINYNRLDYGYFYKFLSNNEIKLVKYTLEDNGFLPFGSSLNPVLSSSVNAHNLMQRNGQLLPANNIHADWMIMWTTKSLKNSFFTRLSKFQRVNQFPKSTELTRKDSLMKKIQGMQQSHGIRNFDFIPKSLLLPKELKELRHAMATDPEQFWIAKPTASSQGKGIIITNKFSDIVCHKKESMIVSHYIANPLLIDGLKFDLRIYVALTSINPLRIYMFDEGLTRFATTPYAAPQRDMQKNLNNLEGKFTHLTNYSINKNNK